MEQIKLVIQRLMAGRYGLDQLNVVILIVATLMIGLSQGLGLFILYLFGLILIMVYFYRIFSKDIYHRGKENQMLLSKMKWIKNKCLLFKHIMDKKYRYFTCPTCYQIVRVPRGRGKIEITCPKCRKKFDKKS
ncbi:MAG: hypothetical protein R3Y57_07745 [Erysipelotrichaceae bacterium]